MTPMKSLIKLQNPFCNQTIFGTNKFQSIPDLSTRYQSWISNSLSSFDDMWGNFGYHLHSRRCNPNGLHTHRIFPPPSQIFICGVILENNHSHIYPQDSLELKRVITVSIKIVLREERSRVMDDFARCIQSVYSIS